MELHIPFMNFLSIFKLLQIRLPFMQTVFSVSMSTFFPYLTTASAADRAPWEPLRAPMSEELWADGDRRGPAAASGERAGRAQRLGASSHQAPPHALILAVGKHDRHPRCLRSLRSALPFLPAPSHSTLPQSCRQCPLRCSPHLTRVTPPATWRAALLIYSGGSGSSP